MQDAQQKINSHAVNGKSYMKNCTYRKQTTRTVRVLVLPARDQDRQPQKVMGL